MSMEAKSGKRDAMPGTKNATKSKKRPKTATSSCLLATSFCGLIVYTVFEGN